MTTTAETYPHYAAAYAAQPADGPDALVTLRQRGWDAFAKLGLPYRSSRQRTLEVHQRRSHRPRSLCPPSSIGLGGSRDPIWQRCKRPPRAQADWRTLVFVDGVVAPGLCHGIGVGASDVLAVHTLADAISSGQGPDGTLSKLAQPEDDGFVALNTAFVRDGAVILWYRSWRRRLVSSTWCTSPPDGNSPGLPIPAPSLSAGRELSGSL